MKNGEKRVRNALCGGEVKGDAAKAKVHDASAMSRLVAEDRVGIGASHRDAFGFSRNRVQARLVRNNGKRRPRRLQGRDWGSLDHRRKGKRSGGFWSGTWLGPRSSGSGGRNDRLDWSCYG